MAPERQGPPSRPGASSPSTHTKMRVCGAGRVQGAGGRAENENQRLCGRKEKWPLDISRKLRWLSRETRLSGKQELG